MFQFKGSLWILTELMDVSLDRFCAKAAQLRVKLPEDFMAQVAFCVLSGLKDMRALKLMHRDIKPANILLNSDGQIKLCDFGISNFTVDSHLNSFKGTSFYMAVMNLKLFIFLNI
jgi:serine/threonine protein kinase